MGILTAFIIIALFFTLGVLLVGVIGMAKGGEFNRKYGNKIMRLRVISQFVTLGLIALFAMLSIGGK